MTGPGVCPPSPPQDPRWGRATGLGVGPRRPAHTEPRLVSSSTAHLRAGPLHRPYADAQASKTTVWKTTMGSAVADVNNRGRRTHAAARVLVMAQQLPLGLGTSEGTTSIPSTETGNACERHPTSPWIRASSAICEYEIAPATPASPTTVAPAAPTILLSTALIAHHPKHAGKKDQTAKRSPRSPADGISTTVPLFVVPPAGFEPATHGLGIRCSIP